MVGKRRRVIAKRSRKDKRNGVKRGFYNVPDQLDIDLHQQEYLRLSKSLDETGAASPLTDNQLKSLIRSVVRERWMYYSTRLSFLNSKLVPDTDPSTRRRFKTECNICKNWFTKSDVDVDHRIGEHSFTKLSQAKEWASSILDVGFDDLQILCTDVCHPIKTLSESHNVTFEEAVFIKKAIAWEKDKNINHKQFLADKGFSDKEVSNKEKRRECYINSLTKQDKN